MQKISIGRYVPAGNPEEETENLRWAFDSALIFLQTVGSLSEHIEVVKVDWILEDGLPLEAVILSVISHPALKHKGEIRWQGVANWQPAEQTARSLRLAAKAALVLVLGEVTKESASLDEAVRAIPFEAV